MVLPIVADIPTLKGETVADVYVNDKLSPEQQQQLRSLLQEYEDIFSDRPGTTSVIEHRIQLLDDNPVRCRAYPVPHAVIDEVIEEVREMERLGVIEKSDSPYSSPLLMVKKKDGRNRPVVDFRKLNKITVFDAEPMPSIENIYGRLSSAQYFSKLDFCKGYWQIPMSVEDRQKTAFCTPIGLYQFTRMPFGLQNACATYSRMMRHVLDGMQQTDNFVDDVLSFTDGWSQHLQELRELFSRVREAGLTVKNDAVSAMTKSNTSDTLSDKVSKVVEAPVTRLEQTIYCKN